MWLLSSQNDCCVCRWLTVCVPQCHLVAGYRHHTLPPAQLNSNCLEAERTESSDHFLCQTAVTSRAITHKLDSERCSAMRTICIFCSLHPLRSSILSGCHTVNICGRGLCQTNGLICQGQKEMTVRGFLVPHIDSARLMSHSHRTVRPNTRSLPLSRFSSSPFFTLKY